MLICYQQVLFQGQSVTEILFRFVRNLCLGVQHYFNQLPHLSVSSFDGCLGNVYFCAISVRNNEQYKLK